MPLGYRFGEYLSLESEEDYFSTEHDCFPFILFPTQYFMPDKKQFNMIKYS